MLGRMFPDAPAKRLFRGVGLAGNGVSLEIDACLNDITEAVIFEIKAVTLREDVLDSRDPEVFHHHLVERYGGSARGGHGRVKGAGQLARIVDTIASGGASAKDCPLGELKVVFPVLLVCDPILPAPGFGSALASEFRRCLVPDRVARPGAVLKGNLLVHDLIILTVEDLENLEGSVANFGFRRFLEDYSRSAPSRNEPVGNFMGESPYASKLLRNPWLAEKADELLHRTGATLFPGVRLAEDG